jgi:hypothetical protein
MATAQRPPLSMMAETPEEQAALQKVMASRTALENALKARENQLFDPVLLAITQGLLAPTKTGSFGEALGNVAAMIGPAQAGEEKRAMDIAQMRSELAAQELGMAQQTRRQQEARRQMRALTGSLTEGAPTAPTATGAATAAPVAASGAMPSGAPGASAAIGAPAPTAAGAPAVARDKLRPIMESDILAMSEVDPDQAAMLEKIMKSQRDRLSIGPNGLVFDRALQDFTGHRVPSQEQKEFTTIGGRIAMKPWEHDLYLKAAKAGMGRQWLDAFNTTDVAMSVEELTAAKSRPGAAASAPGASAEGQPQRRKTVDELKAEEEAQKIIAQERAKGMAKRTEEALNAGEGYASRMALYNSLGKIASRPDAGKIFGILERPGVAEAIISLARDTIKTPGSGSSISVPGLENALRNVGLPQELINQYQFALSQMANLQLLQSRITEGQGSVSERERDLFATASITARDNPATINAKLDMYRARADFDRDIANELRKTGMTLDQFKTERKVWYDNKVQQYVGRVESIVEKLGGVPGAPVKRGPAAVAPSTDAGTKLRQELGIGK